MKLGFDIRPFLKKETGVGIYFKNLLFHLARLDKDNEYFLFTSSWKDRFPSEKIPPFRRLCFRDVRYPVKLIDFLWYRLGLPRLDLFFGKTLDLTHSPTPLLLPTAGRRVVTVYDLFFMDFARQADRQAGRVFRRRIGSSLQRADGIVSISDLTRAQILDRFSVDPAAVRTVHLGVDREFWAVKDEEARRNLRRRLDLPESFLLFVGAFEKRKNITGLLEALKIIQDRRGRIPLVLAGRRGEDFLDVQKRAEELGLGPALIYTGYCPEEELRSLYGMASLLVYPSLWEGFGLPLLEAMSSGLPVTSSRRGAIPEIAGDAALYFDPEDAEDMADRILLALDDTDLRQDLVERGYRQAERFRWERTAEETLALYGELVS
jgi:glycosyltransferase involved in cell wall biosynthesis